MTHLNIETLKASVEILSTSESESLRSRFVEHRIDKQLLARYPGALDLKEFSDGLAYESYLWDFFSEKEVVSASVLWERIQRFRAVYAMWDLHSTERVLIPNYFKFARGTVMCGDPDIFERGISLLPEDLYFFDDSLSWGAALTHEYIDDERFCVWSGRLPATSARESS